ncbi:MAG: alpha/beta hydrolase [Elusimicrobia bacterium]|nr:alpha/beta hydrolase [Elusimicrobiota bacterium]
MRSEKAFAAGGVRINYLETGSPTGAPVVMFHGGAWRWQEYLSLIPALAKRWRVYALDLRGNGGSGWTPGRYRLEDFRDDGAAFLSRFPGPAVLVGHSIGGVVALMVAARCPDRVRALIIEDAPLTAGNYRDLIESSRGMFENWLRLKGSARSRAELSLALAREYRDCPGVTSSWILFFSGCLWQLDPTFFDPLLHDFAGFIRSYDYKRVIGRIRCPILFLRGETKLGAVMTDEELHWLKRNAANAACVEIAGVGHLLHLQDQGQAPVRKEMTAFLERVCRRDGKPRSARSRRPG